MDTFASAEEVLGVDLASTAVVVLDLRMPRMSGLELLVALTRQRPGLPVVILTAHGEDDVRDKCFRAGAVAFLSKPFDTDELLAAVRKGE